MSDQTAIPEPATSTRNWTATETGSNFVSNYPPYSAWNDDAVRYVGPALDGAPPADGLPLGLYLHIPFCRKRCKFCYFRVYTDRNASEIGRYLDALAAEIEIYAQRRRIKGRPLHFVYFGGGTPSYISARHLREFVARVNTVMPWDRAEEVVFECEPGTLTRAKLEAIREIGVTRLSLGIENMNDAILQENGRAHVTKEIHEIMPIVKEMAFDQVNLDLISGMVGESWDTWKETVRRTIDLDPDMVTIYQMELPFNTVYAGQMRSGEGAAPAVADWDTKRAWHEHAIDAFTNAGYEVSSAYTLARKGKPVKFVYRDALWRGADMIGAGVSSFSHMGGLHYQNQVNWDPYLDQVEAGQLPIRRACKLTDEERMTREMILQLKLGSIAAPYFLDKFGVDVLERFRPAYERLESDGMLNVTGDGVRMTRKGLLRVDQLLPNFYDSKYRNARYT
jgi:oxygen-independent coproporphyrinogen-3 oxidase